MLCRSPRDECFSVRFMAKEKDTVVSLLMGDLLPRMIGVSRFKTALCAMSASGDAGQQQGFLFAYVLVLSTGDTD